jgi:hypothetical protein
MLLILVEIWFDAFEEEFDVLLVYCSRQLFGKNMGKYGQEAMVKCGIWTERAYRKLDLKEGHAENWAWMGWPPQILSTRRSPTTIASDLSKP